MELNVLGKTHGELILQHLDYGSLIGSGYINPASLLKLREGSSFIVMSAVVKNAGITLEPATGFVKWQQFQCFPALYDKTIENAGILGTLNKKMKILIYCSPVRNTSRTIHAIAVDMATEKPLFLSTVVIVRVDVKRQLPSPYPLSYKSFYSPENCILPPKIGEKLPPGGQKVCEIPENTLTYTRTSVVNARQIDWNEHVNQASYVDFAFDCIAEAFSKHIFGDVGLIFYHRIRRMSILYLKECRLGDSIDTVAWQDTENAQVFRFHLMRDDVLLCQVEFEFFAFDKFKSRL